MRKIISNQEDSGMDKNSDNVNVAKQTEVKKKRGALRKVADYIKANSVAAKSTITGILVFAVIFAIISNIQIGYAVVLGDETIGYVDEKDLMLERIDYISREVSENTEDQDPEICAQLVPTIAPSFKFAEEEEIEQIIKNELPCYLDAAAVYIDGKFAFAAKDEKTAEAFIKKISG